jgi:8-oxo-dGTP diphosphatase
VVQVVAAILERSGSILICQRTPEQSHPLKWEFPGGKVEPGETSEQALARELEEELGIHFATGDEIKRYHFRYPGKNPIELVFYRVLGYDGEPRNLIFHDVQWVRREQLTQFDFVEGDRDFIRSFSAAR